MKSMKNLLIPFLLLVLFVISGCCLGGKDKKTNFIEDSLRDYMIYSKTDTLFFKTDGGEEEYFLVQSLFHDTVPRHEKFSCDLVEDEMYDLFFEKFPKSQNSSVYSTGININPSGSRLELDGFSCDNFHTYSIGSYDLDGNIFDDVWQNNLLHYDGLNILKMAYSIKSGFLSYEYPDGRKFKRIF
ncbi:MAG: hypothetical protein KIT33_02075 [Candidatus Kapabacteria bacterium]|nr:hypothetical protein [Ignavibacteriota bacterium]MCW5883739.1 hypothetical protein [Candidatus Kapabacteria bacterium]